MSNAENIYLVKKKNNKSNRMKDLFIQELSSCFKKGEQKQPLCIGIHLQVHAHYKDDDRFEPKAIQNGLNRYCNGLKYLRTIIKGASRVDIHGHPVGVVTAQEALYAQDKLQRMEKQRKEQELEKAQKMSLQRSKMPIPKPIPLDELKKRAAVSQAIDPPTPSKEQIKKEKQDKYAKKMARKKLLKKS